MFQLVPPRTGPVLTQGHHMNKLGGGPHGDSAYQISKFHTVKFLKKKRILKVGFFVPTFQLVTPRAGPVLSSGASYE